MTENESGEILAVDNPVTVESGEVATPETEAVETEEQTAEGEAKKRRPSGFHRKISRLQEENARLAAQIAEISKAKQGNEKPVIDNFTTYDEYTEALTDWKVEQRFTERESKAKEFEQIKQKEAANQSWEEKVDSLPDAYDDYEFVVGRAFNNIRLSETVIDAAKEAGPEIVYHIAKNPQLTERIVNMTPAQAIREIIKIESELSKPTVKISKSSEPITPVKGTSKTTVRLDNLDTDSYIAQRHPHLFKR